MNSGEFIDEVVEIFDGPHEDGFQGLLKLIEEMVDRDEDACEKYNIRKQQVAEVTAEKANLQIKLDQMQYMLKVLEDGAEEDERENAELQDRVTCLESDSHNEVSQAEMDEVNILWKNARRDIRYAKQERSLSAERAACFQRENQYYMDFLAEMNADSAFVDFVNKRSDTDGSELFGFEEDK